LASKPIDDPGYFTADALKTYFAAKGITIDGAIQPVPPDAKPVLIATHSTRLADILRRLNKSSQNFMAEALDKLSGERLRQSQPNAVHGTSWEAGAQAARLFLTSHGIDAATLVMADGSGLSRDNRVTARMLTDLLAVMDTHPSAAVFRDSLPVGGVDGTLRRRFTDVKGRVLAKNRLDRRRPLPLRLHHPRRRPPRRLQHSEQRHQRRRRRPGEADGRRRRRDDPVSGQPR